MQNEQYIILLVFLILTPLVNADYFSTCAGNTDYARYDCAIEKAMFAKDPNYCDSLGKFKGYCYYHFGVRNINSTFCEKARAFSHDCFYNISFLTGNVSYCKESGQPDDCIYKMIYTFNNTEWCEGYSNPQICYEKIYKMNPTKQNCNYLKNKPEDCICNKNEYLKEGKCYTLTCPDFQQVSNHKCVNKCKEFQYFKDGNCQAFCPDGFMSIRNGEKCLITLHHLQYVSFTVGKIVLLVLAIMIIIFVIRSPLTRVIDNTNWNFIPLLLILIIYFFTLFLFTSLISLEPDRFLPERCTGPAGVDCVDSAQYETSSGTITIVLRNNLGKNLTLLSKGGHATDHCNSFMLNNSDNALYYEYSNKINTLRIGENKLQINESGVNIPHGENFVLFFPCNKNIVGRIKSDLTFNISVENISRSVTVSVRSSSQGYHRLNNATRVARVGYFAIVIFLLSSSKICKVYNRIIKYKTIRIKARDYLHPSKGKLLFFFASLIGLFLTLNAITWECELAPCIPKPSKSLMIAQYFGFSLYEYPALTMKNPYIAFPIGILSITLYLYLVSVFLYYGLVKKASSKVERLR